MKSFRLATCPTKFLKIDPTIRVSTLEFEQNNRPRLRVSPRDWSHMNVSDQIKSGWMAVHHWAWDLWCKCCFLSHPSPHFPWSDKARVNSRQRNQAMKRQRKTQKLPKPPAFIIIHQLFRTKGTRNSRSTHMGKHVCLQLLLRMWHLTVCHLSDLTKWSDLSRWGGVWNLGFPNFSFPCLGFSAFCYL